MSTREAGSRFENEVYHLVRGWVASGQSFLNPDSCQFFAGKGYYSPDRRSEIVVDVSVECFSAAATAPSLLVVIECKSYSRRVPVDDIEEFKSKIDQIAGKNVKGMLFTTCGFRESGAVEYARSNGIALARVLPEDQVEWVLRRIPRPIPTRERPSLRREQILRALSDSDFRGESEFLFAVAEDLLTCDGIDLINSIVRGSDAEDMGQSTTLHPEAGGGLPTDGPHVKFLGQEEIESRAARMIDFFGPSRATATHVDINAMCDYLSEHHDLTVVVDQDLGVDTHGRDILGRTFTDPLEIQISNRLDRDCHRWRFTLAHELGHLILHRSLNLATVIGSHFETERSLDLGLLTYESTPLGRLEWQANSFAACLLMRRERVYGVVRDHLRRRRLRNFAHGIVFVDDQPCNLASYFELLSAMSKSFAVSKQASSIRLAKLKILNDQRGVDQISQLLRIGGLLG